MHAVHGDEISSSDAALMEAYHLLAARGDAAVDAILRESIVIIDPLENPDGRARFVSTRTCRARPRRRTPSRTRSSTTSRGPAAATTTTSST